MDSTMTIQVRVVGRQAIAQLGQVQAAVNGVSRATGGAAAKNASGFFNVLNSNLVKAGKNFQWVGRQLTFNFTLPLVAAGVALFKANQAIEKSMIQVVKVYGDASFSAARVKEETDALRVSFELLSTRFGIHQEEVIDIAAAWAQAGSAGRGLAENTRATLEAMILGEMDAAEATQGLIAIQATWGLSTMARAGEVSELQQALALLNVVENQTGISFAGLIEVFERAGGAARTAGMTIRELAAFSAALVPATGSAAQAGNALKTMISRLVAPTKETASILGEMGINVDSFAWRSLSATDKILSMADAFNALSEAEKNQVSSIIASRWQVNRFSVLMQDVANQTGYFNKAMDATADQAAANAIYQKELMAVLESSPKKWDIMTNAIRNSMAKAFIPLMPIIMNVIGFIAQLADAFQRLDPDTQKWIMIGLALLAVVGPVMQLGGAFMELGGIIAAVVKGIGLLIIKGLIPVIMFLVSTVVKAAIAIGSAILGIGVPLWAVVAIIAAVVVAIIAILNEDFRNKVWEIIKSVGRAFAALPGVIVTVFNAIIRIIGRAIEIIRDALSYLNPFARHSPSLVDNVKAGVATILDEYSKFKHIPAIIRSAINALNAFGQASAPGARDQQQAELQGYASTISESDPAAGAAASAMIPQIMALQDQLAPLAQEIEAQSIVVAQWTDKLKDADAALAVAEASLEATKNQFEKVSDELDAAKNRLQELANTPLTGMKAMEDILFDISMQQNQLNLQLVEFEKQGYTIDSIREKYAALNGEIELLRGEQADLRNAGAGSDVLAVYDDQIAAIEAQRESMGGVEQQIIDIQNQLDSLDLEKRFQELTKSITFDPLLKQIDEMVNGVNEMSFDDVVAGIQEQQTLIAQLQPQYDSLLATMEEQQAAVDAAQATRDDIAAQLDVEQTKLDGLKDAYQGIKNLIDEMTAAMRDYASAAEDAASAGGGGAGAGGGLGVPADYPIAGGSSTLGPEGVLADIEAFNAELEAELQGVLESMGSLDIMGTLREKFDAALKWVKEAWNTTWEWVKEKWNGFTAWLSGAWKSITSSGFIAGIINGFKSIVNWFSTSFIPFFQRLWTQFTEYAMVAVNWINENVVPVFVAIGEFIVAAWAYIGPVVELIWNGLIEIIRIALGAIFLVIEWGFGVIKGIFEVAWGVIQGIWDIGWGLIKSAVEITWGLIKGIIEGALKIIKGIFQVFTGILTGDWSKLWEGIKSILSGAWQVITTIISTAWGIIKTVVQLGIDAVKLVFTTAIDAIKLVWDGLWEGIKNAVKLAWLILEGLVRTGIRTIKTIIEVTTKAIGVAWDLVWGGITGAVEGAWNTIKGIVQKIVDWISDKIDWVMDQIDKIPDPTNLGGGADTPWVPWARGGIVRTPTFGVAGEAGPEVIIPLTDARRAAELVRQSGLTNIVASAHAKIGTPMRSRPSGGGTNTTYASTSSHTQTQVIQINGNLEFPNITNGGDASKFIENLKVIAS